MPAPQPGARRPSSPSSGSQARVFTIIGFVCAAAAVVVLPLLFGVAAIVLGLVGRSRGDPLGQWAAVAGAAGMVVGMVLAVLALEAAGALGGLRDGA